AQGLPEQPWHDARRLDIELLLWRMREHGEQGVLTDFVDRAVGPLLVHDRSARQPLLPTLEAYLASAGRKAETARDLNVNRQAAHGAGGAAAAEADVQVAQYAPPFFGEQVVTRMRDGTDPLDGVGEDGQFLGEQREGGGPRRGLGGLRGPQALVEGSKKDLDLVAVGRLQRQERGGLQDLLHCGQVRGGQRGSDL
ncbi:hypothetical protein, partial [Bacillus cereus]|uniref:hypothetical protein n=1 Tax=Bacillus cereus TaxID=1396 RepID=UPI003CFD586D